MQTPERLTEQLCNCFVAMLDKQGNKTLYVAISETSVDDSLFKILFITELLKRQIYPSGVQVGDVSLLYFKIKHRLIKENLVVFSRFPE